MITIDSITTKHMLTNRWLATSASQNIIHFFELRVSLGHNKCNLSLIPYFFL